MSERTRRGAGGRPGSVDEARELVALVSSLSEAGDAIDATAVAARLGATRERAEKLLSLVLTAHTATGAGLPLAEDGDALALVSADGTHGRALRLTRPETLALVSALERIGVAADSPLRARLESALSADPVDEDLVRRLVDARTDDTVAGHLAACARALASRQDLSFSYRRLDSSELTTRTVRPLDLRVEDGAWLLDGFDLDRAGERTFRVDRMTDVVPRPPAPAAPTRAAERGKSRPTRLVRLRFSDPRYLDLLPWHDLSVEKTGPSGVTQARTPWYGGSWLVRMIAACGGTCSTDDPELADEVRACAAAALG